MSTHDKGFIITIGKQGHGKTLMTTKLAFTEYKKNKRFVLSNYSLFGIPFTRINKGVFKNLITNDELIKSYFINGIEINIYQDYYNCYGKYPLTNFDYLIDSIILIDEIHIWLDAYHFYKDDDIKISAFFSQIRKRRILLLATTQYLLNLNIRVRRQLSYVLDMRVVRENGRKLYKCTTNEVDGFYSQELSTNVFDLQDYYKCYDTEEVIEVWLIY